MKCKKTISLFLLLGVAVVLTECKGGGRGGGRGRGGGSRGSSGGWFSSKSSSSSSSSGGWFSSKSSSSSHGSSSRNSHGAPPAYPGLGNRAVSHPYKPPAYTPTYNAKPYGTAFGSSGLPRDTYIHNNYYGGPGGYTSSQGYHSVGDRYLTNALFFRRGTYSGSYGGHSSYQQNSWDGHDDQRWRETTKAPYFENKVPGEANRSLSEVRLIILHPLQDLTATFLPLLL